MASIRLFALIPLLVVAQSVAGTARAGSLSEELRRLGVDTALVVRSQEIDESPVWSPDGRSIALNLAGAWKRVSLTDLRLEKAKWHGGDPIAVVEAAALSPVSEPEVQAWERRGKGDPRQLVTSAGVTVELRSVELGTRFLVGRSGEKPKALWTTDLENCHSLALSPDELFVAFVCELNGLIVYRLRPASGR